MRRLRLCLLFFLVFMLAFSLVAREVTVSGIVVSAKTGDPLVGANVNVLGTNVGGATNTEGFFTFTFDAEEDFTIKIGYMGSKSKEMVLAPEEKILGLKIQLEEDVLESEQVVVTGIASETSKEVAPIAVGTVNATKLS